MRELMTRLESEQKRLGDPLPLISAHPKDAAVDASFFPR
jgi:hypothetical protein